MKIFFFTITIAMAVSGCATTTWVPYHKDAEPIYDDAYRINSPIIVAVQDQRPYVLSNKKTPFFFGITRSLYGIPYTVNGPTTNTDDMLFYIDTLIGSDSSSYSIQKRAIDINIDGLSEVKQNQNSKPAIYIETFEWKTDAPAIGTTSISYDLRAQVLDSSGSIVLQKETKGKDPFVDPDPGTESKGITGRWYQKAKIDTLGKILLDPEFVAAVNQVTDTKNSSYSKTANTSETELITEPIEEDVPAKESQVSGCSTEQVLIMKNSGLSDDQITKACG